MSSSITRPPDSDKPNDFVEKEVKQNLRIHEIATDLDEDILKEVENKLERHGAKIDYY